MREEVMQTSFQSDCLSIDEPHCTSWHGLIFEKKNVFDYWIPPSRSWRNLRSGARTRITDLRTRKRRSPFRSYIHLYYAGKSGV